MELQGSGVEEVKEIISKKEYPLNYPKDAVKVINAMSFSNGDKIEVLGSMAIRSMLYASDYDTAEVVDRKNSKQIVKDYQAIIRNLLSMKKTYIGDIKLGEIKDWKIIDDSAYFKNGRYWGYDQKKSLDKVKELYKTKIITKDELELGKKLLIKKPSNEQLKEIIKMLRFNILRWTPQDVLNGFIVLRTGEKYPLDTAVRDPTLFKMDIISLLENGVFQEFSIIYDLRIKGRRINIYSIDTRKSLIKDILFYSYIGNWFKVLKRMFSYFTYNFKYVRKYKEESIDAIESLFGLLNSDLGILYNLTQDITMLSYLVVNEKNAPIKEIKEELDSFITRLSNVYSISSFLKAEPSIVAKIHQITTARSNPETLARDLESLEERVSKILSKETLVRIKETGLGSLIDAFKAIP